MDSEALISCLFFACQYISVIAAAHIKTGKKEYSLLCFIYCLTLITKKTIASMQRIGKGVSIKVGKIVDSLIFRNSSKIAKPLNKRAIIMWKCFMAMDKEDIFFASACIHLIRVPNLRGFHFLICHR